ncbi:ER-derived vesicles protein erv29 [Cystobasidiomycetes sp. EMM_F5]
MSAPAVSVTPASPDQGGLGASSVTSRRTSYQPATSGVHQRTGSQPSYSYPSRPQSSYAGPSYTPDTTPKRSNPDAPLEQVRRVTSKVEDAIDTNFRWVKPYLPVLGRFLIVVTFLEDALRYASLDKIDNILALKVPPAHTFTASPHNGAISCTICNDIANSLGV